MHTSPARLLAFTAALSLLLLPLAPVLAEGLAADGRVGVVVDRQGVVSVRPAGRQRWTPLKARDVVYPGDRLRTETRGAHALDVRLAGGARFTLGPGALLDVQAPQRFVLLAGEAEFVGTESTPLSVTFGAGKGYEIKETRWLKTRDGQVEALQEAPRWLTGYRAGTSEEWMGSLLVQVDGRDVPLSVGWHKVEVEIKDQVARTTVDQTFVNATDQRLEGTFRFPLPAEASVSGFGMWIGSELVEADVVERERARQIYEDILRRKKDPGLLEWAGGNMFQARVFPIEPRSEKRVRIRYTEVLPLENGAWRYRYALRSELLRQRPLRELGLTVRVASTQVLSEVTCPTHADATVSADEHTAQVELSQRDVRPEKDFEVAGRVKAGDGLTVVAHRRGGDGYFMLLLQPPEAGSAGWQRDLVPEGAPLDVLLLVDTSASVDASARKAQTTFLTALLGLLGPEDKVRAATLDTRTRWLSDAALGAGPETTDKVLAFVGARAPRGWTDLEGALGEALAKAGPRTQVIYLGDGIATSGDMDAVALAQRLRGRAGTSQAVVHAVAPSSAYEKPVLDALAAIGGGSVRHLKEDPAGVAQRLLTEAALPLLRDMQVEIQGLPTARVYPQRLPNMAAGSQQAVLGRFLPDLSKAGAAAATVVVTGTLEGKPVRFTSSLAVPGDQEGNSFLPRLWARRHLDALLEQGDAAAVKDEVVRFSIEHTIMTPYTSLLVLESDEDRERYGVERRVKARDGESEFAQAGDQAALAAAKRAIQSARGWRLGLRRQMIRELAGLGRDLDIPVPAVAVSEFGAAADQSDSAHLLAFAGEESLKLGEQGAGMSGGFGGRAGGSWDAGGVPMAAPGAPPAPTAAAPMLRAEAKGEKFLEAEGGDFEDFASAADKPGDPSSGDDVNESLDDLEELAEEAQDAAKDARGGERARRGLMSRKAGYFAPGEAREPGFEFGLSAWARREGTLRMRSDASLLGFPARGSASYDRPPEPEPPVADAAVRAHLVRLFRPEAPTAPSLEVRQRGWSVHPKRGQESAPWERRLLVGSDAWYARHVTEAGVGERSLTAGVVTAYDPVTRLARAWNGGPEAAWRMDELRASLGLPTARSVQNAVVTLGTTKEAGVVTLVISRPPSPGLELWSIQESTGQLLEIRRTEHGELRQRVAYSGGKDVQGHWWPAEVRVFNDRDELVSRQTWSVEGLEAAAVAERLTAAHAGRDGAIVLGPEESTLREARWKLAQQQAGLAERIVLCLDRLAASRFDEAWTHLDAGLAPLGGRPGAMWVTAALLAHTRQGENLRKQITEALRPMVEASGPLLRPAGERLLGLAGSLAATEQLELLEQLLYVAASRVDQAETAWVWGGRRAALLAASGRGAQAREIYVARAQQRPHDLNALQEHVGALWQAGRIKDAIAALTQAIESQGPWSDEDRDALEGQRVESRYQRLRLADALAGAESWVKARPDAHGAWHQRTSLLYLLGRTEEADAWVTTTLKQVGRGAAETREERAQVAAAIHLALGNGWNFYSEQTAPLFAEALLDRARFAASQEDARLAALGEILGDWRVVQAADARALIANLRTQATAPAALASWSTRRLAAVLTVLGWDQAAADQATFERVLTAIEQRLAVATTPSEADALAQLGVFLCDQRGALERSLAVRRRAREQAQGRRREDLTRALLDLFHGQPYTAALEEECVALLPEAIDGQGTSAQRSGRAGAHLRRFVAWALLGRSAALLGTAEEQARRPRAEARLVERQARLDARRALAARLASISWSPSAAPWATLERLALLSEVRESLDLVAAGAQALLPVPPDGELQTLPLDHPRTAVESVLHARAALLLAHAASRRGAPDALAAQALEAFQQRWDDERHDWRYESFRLLIALDRIEPLEALLKGWADATDVLARWRRAEGYLAAEQGRLEPAAQAFESLYEVEGALAGQDLDALGLWLLALGQEARRARAVTSRFEAMNEWELRGYVQSQPAGAVGPGGMPGRLPPEVFEATRLLMRKAQYPQQYLWVVNNLYRGTKDHRAIAALADAIPGHSAQAVYAFLQQFAGVIDQVHEEATLDELAKAAEERRKAVSSPLDQRGLALLLSKVGSRASQVVARDPQHAARALAMLQAAARPVAADEIRPLAGYLASLGTAKDERVAQERLQQLEELARTAEVASGDRLAVTQALAVVHWGEGRHDAALDRLAAAFDEARASGDPRAAALLPQALETRLQWLAQRGRFADAETLLEDARARATDTGTHEALLVRRAHLWAQGLAKGGAMRLGRGEALFREAVRQVEHDWAATPTQSQGLHSAHAALFKAAVDAKLALPVGPLRVDFARERLGPLLVGHPSHTADRIQLESNVLDQRAGPRAALGFLLDRVEAQPRWYARLNQDVWSQQEWNLLEWRAKAEPLGDLAPRLLALVKQVLQQRLRAENSNASGFWHHHNQRAWRAAFPELMAAALAVAEEAPASSGRQAACATALMHLGRNHEALGLLQAAEARGHLDTQGRRLLVNVALQLKRHADALPLIDRLLALTPQTVDLHVMRATALAGLGKIAEAQQALEAALAHSHDAGGTLGKAQALGNLAASARETLALNELAATWAREALTRSEQSGGAYRGSWNVWRRTLALALSALGRTDEAVDVAALVALTERRPQRGQVGPIDDEELLEKLLLAAKDLDAYVTRFEAKVAKDGADVPLLRQALARVYRHKQEPAKAIRQLEALREVVPHDVGALRALVALYDETGQPGPALAALEAVVTHDPGGADAWEDLGRRLALAGQIEEAERAFTSAVELRPLEPDGQRLLARVRAQAGQHVEAAERWRLVTRVRPLEPEGRLEEALAWIAAREPARARAALDALLKTTYEERFVSQVKQAQDLLGSLK